MHLLISVPISSAHFQLFPACLRVIACCVSKHHCLLTGKVVLLLWFAILLVTASIVRFLPARERCCILRILAQILALMFSLLLFLGSLALLLSCPIFPLFWVDWFHPKDMPCPWPKAQDHSRAVYSPLGDQSSFYPLRPIAAWVTHHYRCYDHWFSPTIPCFHRWC